MGRRNDYYAPEDHNDIKGADKGAAARRNDYYAPEDQ